MARYATTTRLARHTFIRIDLGVEIYRYTHSCGGTLSNKTGRYFARRCLVKMNTAVDVGDLEDDY